MLKFKKKSFQLISKLDLRGKKDNDRIDVLELGGMPTELLGPLVHPALQFVMGLSECFLKIFKRLLDQRDSKEEM